MQTKVLHLKQDTPTTWTLLLEKPVGFTYTAGQFINLTLPAPHTDARLNKRNFTLASAPHEPYLQITTKPGPSAFKQAFFALKPNDVVTFTGPLGRYVLDDTPTPVVFLAGGIGVTPFHSMLKDAINKKVDRSFTLIYSNISPNDIPFQKEFDEYLKKGSQYMQIHYTFTQEFHESHRKGRIDQTTISELAPHYKESRIYICGPVQMVLELKKTVVEMGASLDQIHIELFTGYTE